MFVYFDNAITVPSAVLVQYSVSAAGAVSPV
jgi:hypothetical protein